MPAAPQLQDAIPPAGDDDPLEPWELDFIERLAAADAARLYALAKAARDAV